MSTSKKKSRRAKSREFSAEQHELDYQRRQAREQKKLEKLCARIDAWRSDDEREREEAVQHAVAEARVLAEQGWLVLH